MIVQGSNFYNIGKTNNIAPRFVVAIAYAETSLWKNITWGAYNAWNWGWNVKNRSDSPFKSWASGINSVTKGVGGSYYSIGTPSTDAAASFYFKYCSGPDCGINGINNLTNFLLQQGGNVSQLQFPAGCKDNNL